MWSRGEVRGWLRWGPVRSVCLRVIQVWHSSAPGGHWSGQVRTGILCIRIGGRAEGVRRQKSLYPAVPAAAKYAIRETPILFVFLLQAGDGDGVPSGCWANVCDIVPASRRRPGSTYCGKGFPAMYPVFHVCQSSRRHSLLALGLLTIYTGSAMRMINIINMRCNV